MRICHSVVHSWLSPLLRKSRQEGTLHLDDLYELPPHLDPTRFTNELESNWFDEMKLHPDRPNLIRATLRTLGWKPFLNGIFPLLYVKAKNTFTLIQLFFLQGITQIIQPLLLIQLMKFFEPCHSMPTWHAWLLTLATIFIALFASLLSHQVRSSIYFV